MTTYRAWLSVLLIANAALLIGLSARLDRSIIIEPGGYLQCVGHDNGISCVKKDGK